jgi:hypothetical protein
VKHGPFAGCRSFFGRQFRNISQKLGQDAFATQISYRDILNLAAARSAFQFIECLLAYVF